MAEYLVQDSSLNDIADAIRKKGGTSDALAFPDGFVNAIGAIQSGGQDLLAAKLMNTLTNYSSDEITTLGYRAFANTNSLEYISLPNLVKTSGGNAFSDCPKLKTGYFPKWKTLSGSDFINSKGLTNLELPSASSIPSMFFSGCSSLKKVVLHVANSILGRAMNGCTSLTTLVLKSNTMVSLGNIDCFSNCGTTINVYVPSSLLSDYQNGTNWSAVTGATLNFVALEGSEYE